MTRGVVDRCVCHEQTFADLLAVAHRSGASTVDELQLEVDFGRGCGSCRAYVALVLATGCTSLPVLPVASRNDSIDRRASAVENLPDPGCQDPG